MSARGAKLGALSRDTDRTVACDALLSGGMNTPTVAKRLGLSLGYVERRSGLLSSERAGGGRDTSCPRFVHDDKFQALVIAHGGMPVAVRQDDRTVWLGPDGHVWRELRP